MIYEVDHPNLAAGISDEFLVMKYVTTGGPLVVAVEKSAIVFDPPGSRPENEQEWAVVRDSIGEQLKSRVVALAKENDIVRTSGDAHWHHLDLTAQLLKEKGIILRTQAHWMRRNQHF